MWRSHHATAILHFLVEQIAAMTIDELNSILMNQDIALVLL